ncbi:Ubiquitin-conjugating enzyme E2 T [Coemansia thaxteri]|uniref:Ubiquitin-conjugating enzyme E2 T n=1 Tax=Coemansia thaxteri TaxID=2663907 RepID=A0A9W8BDJ9_9FUNG|nr:Ubiquitin-conjugating enzyme E2 T [Coemansia thaxteri]KAJ2007248.1 Ubiquitin-conjugating enzyme E2 T [Coemansia thaxteri]KAJ2471654.1 Ubiquitin-conjugating enzyme E2 T [Coemansia sp. RSA 2322]KAJ2485247.1 Ubiquitin-conjugating enzyme E2 T [Coemansia sp. RSA 2320]
MDKGGQWSKRLLREFRFLQTELPPGISCTPREDRLDHYDALIDGPPGTPYEGGQFRIDVVLPNTYGVDPPALKFKTPIYHPNIDDHGNICLDVLKTGSKGTWRPSWTLDKVLISLVVLLGSPNPHDPLMPEVAEHLLTDPAAFAKTAAEWTARHASASADCAELQPSDLNNDTNSAAVISPRRSARSAAASSKSPAATTVSTLPAASGVSVGAKRKLGLSRKSAAPSTTATAVPDAPVPGRLPGTGMRRLGLSRSKNNSAHAKRSGSAATDAALLSQGEATEGISDDSVSGTNSLYLVKSPSGTASSCSLSPSSAKQPKRIKLAKAVATPSPSVNRKTKRNSTLPPKLAATHEISNHDDPEGLSFLDTPPDSIKDFECLLGTEGGSEQLTGGLESDSLAASADLLDVLSTAKVYLPSIAHVAGSALSEQSEDIFVSQSVDATPPPSSSASLEPEPIAASVVVAAVSAAKAKNKGKAADYQSLPPPPARASLKRERQASDGQVLSESHFGPLDLGLPPIRVSAQRSLMRRKMRPSDNSSSAAS